MSVWVICGHSIKLLRQLFPQNYHEPYYESYTAEDFCGLATAYGLTYVRIVNAFVCKVMVFDKPAVNERQASF